MPDEQSKKVESLSQFIECLKSIPPSKDEIVVYRGHSDVDYELKPGLFRKGNERLRDNEAEIFRDIEAARPMSFINDRTTLDKLVTMQHYGLPTRLLDVTSNPLTALYFAVVSQQGKNQEKDGAVLVLKISQGINKFFDSDTVTCLANLVHLSKDEQFDVLESIKKKTSYLNWVSEYLKILSAERPQKVSSEENENKKIKYEIVHDKYEKYKSTRLEEEPDLTDKKIDQGFRDEQERECREDFNGQKVLKHFLHFIRADKTFFEPNINPKDLLKVLLVKAKQRNSRVAAQSGAFLIFGLEDKTLRRKNIEKIIIPGKKKEEFTQELNSLGINKSSLFPELEYYTRHVVDVYNNS